MTTSNTIREAQSQQDYNPLAKQKAAHLRDGAPSAEKRIERLDRCINLLIDHRGAEPLTVWDSLAICEYLADRFPDAKLWPADRALRARARAISAEMHSGFSGLRNAMPMNCRGRHPGKGQTPAAMADIVNPPLDKYLK